MSLYEQLIQEGRQEGLEEGLISAVKAMAKLNMDAKAIATALNLPLKQVQRYLAQPD